MPGLRKITSEDTRYHVGILTHESVKVPFEQTIVDLLSQLFVTSSAYLLTSILVEDLNPLTHTGPIAKTAEQQDKAQSIVMINKTRYRKICVAGTKQFQQQEADVLFVQCHGFGDKDHLSGLDFRCAGRGKNPYQFTAVWAKPRRIHPGLDDTESPSLHSVIGGCRLVVMLCCCGPYILEEFLEDVCQQAIEMQEPPAFPPFPDLLISNQDAINEWSVEIYMALFMNIFESYRGQNLDLIYDDTRNTIIKIMQIVKLFDDNHVAFWLFLEHIGIITYITDEKIRQELPFPEVLQPAFLRPKGPQPPFFRVQGRLVPYTTESSAFPWEILEDFQSIRLVCSGDSPGEGVVDHESEAKIKIITCKNVTDFNFSDDKSDKVYSYLRHYEEISRDRPESPNSRDRSQSPIPRDGSPSHSNSDDSSDDEVPVNRTDYDSGYSTAASSRRNSSSVHTPPTP